MRGKVLDLGSRDTRRIALRQTFEIQFWMRAFGVSEFVLRRAVAAVGYNAENVREHLASEERRRSEVNQEAARHRR